MTAADVRQVVCFPNGVHMAFDSQGEPVPEAQLKPWFRLLMEELERAGAPLGEIQFVMPNRRVVRAVRVPDGWSWEGTGEVVV